MSERANASVIPFKVDDDDAEEAEAEQGVVENPAERLALAEAVRMPGRLNDRRSPRLPWFR